jgi:DNA processing protein
MKPFITGYKAESIGREGHNMTGKEYCIEKSDALYPEKLRQIRNAPKRLYVRGMLPQKGEPCVAIIGARRCSDYGKKMAQIFAAELAGAGIQIISGMALGVDGIAQTAALAAGGRSCAVLGCGTDICYPNENRELYERLLLRGGILSEYAQGTPPLAVHFPARNRIISALADLIIVVEAKEKSGTLITVDFALEQGKEVYALPGRTTDELSKGCNRLLSQGAGIALSPQDILTALGRKVCCSREKDALELPLEALDKKQRLVLGYLDDRPIGLTALYENILTKEGENALKLAELTDILIGLVIKGMVLCGRGNQYQRNGRFQKL